MKKAVKYVLAFLGTTVILTFVLFGAILYKTEFERKLIETYISDNGEYQLDVYEIGEPDWPFGSTHCGFVLSHCNSVISRMKFTIYNDGGWAHSSNFLVSWHDDKVSIIVSGEEQSDTLYNLFFDEQ